MFNILDKLPNIKLKEVVSQMSQIYESFGSNKETKFEINPKDISNYMTALVIFKKEKPKSDLQLNFDLTTSTLILNCEPHDLFFYRFYYACVLNESQPK